MLKVDGLHIDRTADLGIVLEKNFTLEIAYNFLKTDKNCKKLQKLLNPLWGQEIICFDYGNCSCCILSAQGPAFAANAVERLKRTGVKCIFYIGTTGSTDTSIKTGQYVLPLAAVRDEGTTLGYLDIEVPAVSDLQTTLRLEEEFKNLGISPLLGTTYTTDKRYKENPKLLKKLYKNANVLCIDMETSAIFVTAMSHQLPAAAVKIVTDCAVKETKSEVVGAFDASKDYYSWIKPKIITAIKASLESFLKCQKYTKTQKK